MSKLTLDTLLSGFQTKSLTGLQDRLELLKNLASVLQNRPDYFGGEEGHVPRPGNMMGNINKKKGVNVCLFTLYF